MEKKISETFNDGQSYKCYSIAYFGIAFDESELREFCRKQENSEKFGKIIKENLEDYYVSTIDEFEETEGSFNSEMGRNISEGIAAIYGLDSTNGFTEWDTDYYLIGVSLGNGNGVEELSRINGLMPYIMELSDLFGIKFGFYSSVGWTDFD